MAVQVDGNQRTFKAAADLTAASNRFKIVKLDSSGNVVIATAGTDASVGILQETAKNGGNAIVRLRSGAGTAKVVAGGSISVGDKVTATTAGAAIATTTDGDEIVGQAIQAADSGDIFEIMLATDRVYIA